MRNNKGFSLVELIVVIAIMAILAAVAIPTFATFIGKAQNAADVDFMNQVESAIELAYAQETANIVSIKVACTDGKPTAVTVTFDKEVDGSETAEIKPEHHDDGNAKADAAAVIDWNYEFKSVKTGSFKVNAEGKELETAQ